MCNGFHIPHKKRSNKWKRMFQASSRNTRDWPFIERNKELNWSFDQLPGHCWLNFNLFDSSPAPQIVPNCCSPKAQRTITEFRNWNESKPHTIARYREPTVGWTDWTPCGLIKRGLGLVQSQLASSPHEHMQTWKNLIACMPICGDLIRHEMKPWSSPFTTEGKLQYMNWFW